MGIIEDYFRCDDRRDDYLTVTPTYKTGSWLVRTKHGYFEGPTPEAAILAATAKAIEKTGLQNARKGNTIADVKKPLHRRKS